MTRLILKILSLHGGWYYVMNNTALQGELAAFAFLFWSRLFLLISIQHKHILRQYRVLLIQIFWSS